MKRKIELCMTLLLLVGMMIVSRKLSHLVSGENVKKEQAVIVIDPGHGGEDPGKVGVNEVLEKDINLAIAMQVKEGLEKAGIRVIMTREDDFVPDSKKQDLKERVQLINETKAPLTVCIHQNSYTDPKVKGAQVFYYSESQEGREAAEMLQEEFRKIDPENKRETKDNGSYYMLKHTNVPTIIAECGFLSNPEEAEKLTTDEYQFQIATAICEGIVKWLEK